MGTHPRRGGAPPSSVALVFPRMRVAEVIREHRERILARWVEAVSATLPEGMELPRAALLDSLPEFLDRLVAWLESGENGLHATAAKHGVTRLRQEIDPSQIVAEYGLLRSQLVDLVRTTGAAEDDDLRRLHLALDDCIAASVEALVRTRVEDSHRARTSAAERRTSAAEAARLAAEAHHTSAQNARRAAEGRVAEAEGRVAEAQRARHASESARVGSEAARLTAEARERASDAARMRAEKTADDVELFMAVLAHDLRTPLTTILSAASLMSRRGELGPGDATAASRIARSGDRMNRMIEQLLDFTRIRLGGGLLPQREELDLHPLVEQLVGELELTAPGRPILLEYGDAGRLRGDRGLVSQAISNLLRNAVEHGPGESPVGVVVRGDPSSIEITVRNEGPPIAPDVMRQLFDPFAHRRRGSRGLGLGLYITQQIARAHGGELEASSDEEAGTAFTLRLPRG